MLTRTDLQATTSKQLSSWMSSHRSRRTRSGPPRRPPHGDRGRLAKARSGPSRPPARPPVRRTTATGPRPSSRVQAPPSPERRSYQWFLSRSPARVTSCAHPTALSAASGVRRCALPCGPLLLLGSSYPTFARHEVGLRQRSSMGWVANAADQQRAGTGAAGTTRAAHESCRG